MNYSDMSAWLFSETKSTGVSLLESSPLSPTAISVPFSNSSRTASTCPFSEAQCSGVSQNEINHVVATGFLMSRYLPSSLNSSLRRSITSSSYSASSDR